MQRQQNNDTETSKSSATKPKNSDPPQQAPKKSRAPTDSARNSVGSRSFDDAANFDPALENPDPGDGTPTTAGPTANINPPPPIDHRVIGRKGYAYATVGGRVIAWNPRPAAGQQNWRTADTSGVQRLALGANGKLYAVINREGAHAIFELDQAGNTRGDARHVLDHAPSSLAMTLTGEFLTLQDTEGGTLVHRLDPDGETTSHLLPFTARSVATGEDGTVLLLSGDGAAVYRVNADTGGWGIRQPPPQALQNLATLHDGSIAGEDASGQVYRYSARSNQWAPLRNDETWMRPFDEVHRQLGGWRLGATANVGPFSTEIGREGLQDLSGDGLRDLRGKPLWKQVGKLALWGATPSYLLKDTPGQSWGSVVKRWKNHAGAHYNPIRAATPRGDRPQHITDSLRKQAGKDWAQLLSAPGIDDGIAYFNRHPDFRNHLDDVIQDVDRNAKQVLDRLEAQLGVTPGKAWPGRPHQGSRKFQAPSRVVCSDDNVIFRLLQTREALFGRNNNQDPIARRLRNLLARNIYLPRTGRDWAFNDGTPSVIKNKFEVLTGQLINDHAALVRAAKALPNAADDGAVDGIHDWAANKVTNHTLNALRQGSVNNLDRFEDIESAMDYFNRAFADAGHKLMRALSRQGAETNDPVDKYMHMIGSMDANEKLILRSDFSLGVSARGVTNKASWFLSMATAGLVELLPDVGASRTREYRIEVEKKDGKTEIKIGRGIRYPVGASVRGRLGIQAGLPDSSAKLFAGMQWRAGPQAERSEENLAYITVPDDNPQALRSILRDLFDGRLDPVRLMRMDGVRHDNERRAKVGGRLMDANVGAGTFVSVKEPTQDATRNFKVGPSAYAGGSLLGGSIDERRRHGPGQHSQPGRVTQNVPFRGRLGASLLESTGTFAIPHRMSPASSNETVVGTSVISSGIQKEFDRATGAEIKAETKYENGRYKEHKVEWIAQNASRLLKSNCPRMREIRNAINADPTDPQMQTLGRLFDDLQKTGKPVTLVYKLTPAAEQQIANYDATNDGEYQPFVERVSHDRGNWRISELWIRDAKSYETSGGVSLGLRAGGAARIELQKIQGKVKFRYVAEDNPHVPSGFDKEGDLLTGPLPKPDFNALQQLVDGGGLTHMLNAMVNQNTTQHGAGNADTISEEENEDFDRTIQAGDVQYGVFDSGLVPLDQNGKPRGQPLILPLGATGAVAGPGGAVAYLDHHGQPYRAPGGDLTQYGAVISALDATVQMPSRGFTTYQGLRVKDGQVSEYGVAVAVPGKAVGIVPLQEGGAAIKLADGRYFVAFAGTLYTLRIPHPVALPPGVNQVRSIAFTENGALKIVDDQNRSWL
ncbi:MAG: hypothetical protein WED00_13945 [Aquisalimonadaceae bacterium]